MRWEYWGISAEADKTMAGFEQPQLQHHLGASKLSPLVSLTGREAATELGHGHPKAAVLWESAEFAVGDGCQNLHGCIPPLERRHILKKPSLPPSLSPSLPPPQTIKLHIHGHCGS